MTIWQWYLLGVLTPFVIGTCGLVIFAGLTFLPVGTATVVPFRRPPGGSSPGRS